MRTVRAEIAPRASDPHEAKLLMLDSAKARQRLGWRPLWNIDRTLQQTVDWYRAHHERGELLSAQQIDEYTAEAAARANSGIFSRMRPAGAVRRSSGQTSSRRRTTGNETSIGLAIRPSPSSSATATERAIPGRST